MKALFLPLNKKTFIPIDREEAMRMVKAGAAEAYGASTPYAYREVTPAPKVEAKTETPETPEQPEAPDQTYATRDMAAQAKPVRRRGRPRKNPISE